LQVIKDGSSTALPIPATLVEYRPAVVCEKGNAVNDRRFGSVALRESTRVTDVGSDSQSPGNVVDLGTHDPPTPDDYPVSFSGVPA
jgi:hypothetical protein